VVISDLIRSTLQLRRALAFPGKRPSKLAVEGRRASDHGGDNNQTGLYGTLDGGRE